jgi:hypothetical protein
MVSGGSVTVRVFIIAGLLLKLLGDKRRKDLMIN